MPASLAGCGGWPGRWAAPWTLAPRATSWLRRRLRLSSWLYRLLGLDWQVLCWRWQGVERGAFHSRLLRLRTGERLAAVPDLRAMLADPERYRVV